ncbi:hypothetical protein AMATHDRAFT_74413 [Amanita thiersii Skay4041]|uniref:Uncharacterized protein n=1 Tax=Amanita thiersii Skay4041 TaxID=703135 RepID=A0A2A9NV12_9AGAR|nr:hypothetical protein AMATHDRAFT_74413 [Amanita thiersii Skay4041]
MSENNEDALPGSQYTCFWSSKSELSLDDFLAKYRPSMVQNDGTKPWIWVQRGTVGPSNNDDNHFDAIVDATDLLTEYTARIESIKDDPSIPIRSSKKKGVRSKKESREELQAEAADKLKEVSLKYHYYSGKWLLFAPADKVDSIWSSLAKSLVSGPLASSSATLAKVSTSPATEVPFYQHVICLYIPNVYDKEDVTAVMKILLRNHGFNLSGVKSTLYTLIGLSSKHPSGIQSTIWKNTALMSDTDMKALKDAFYSGSIGKKHNDKADTGGSDMPEGSHSQADNEPRKTVKPKSKLKKKAEANFFASDDEQETKEEQSEPTKAAQQKRTKQSDDEPAEATVKKRKI